MTGRGRLIATAIGALLLAGAIVVWNARHREAEEAANRVVEAAKGIKVVA